MGCVTIRRSRMIEPWSSSRPQRSPRIWRTTSWTTNTGPCRHSWQEIPEAGDVIPGTGGFRKLRWADPVRGKGKRGGLRVVYYYLLSDAQIWLMTLYNKGEMSDLNAAEKRALKSALEAELARRSVRRAPRRT